MYIYCYYFAQPFASDVSDPLSRLFQTLRSTCLNRKDFVPALRACSESRKLRIVTLQQGGFAEGIAKGIPQKALRKAFRLNIQINIQYLMFDTFYVLYIL